MTSYFLPLFRFFDAAENTYSCLCSYNRDQYALVAIDTADIDFEAINLLPEKAVFSNSGAFTLEDDDHWVWHDDAVTPADGIALERG